MPDINVTTDSARPQRRIDTSGYHVSDNNPVSRIGILAIHNSTHVPHALRALSTAGSANLARGKLHTFMHELWFILKGTTQILQKHYEAQSNSLTSESKKAENPVQSADMDMKAYHLRKKIGSLKETVMRRSGEHLSGLQKRIADRKRVPAINENAASLLFSAKKSVSSSDTRVLPTALTAPQRMGHATEHHPLHKPLNHEKRLMRRDRRNKNIGPPGEIERRRADRRKPGL